MIYNPEKDMLVTWTRAAAVEDVRNYISKQETITFADGLNVGLREPRQ